MFNLSATAVAHQNVAGKPNSFVPIWTNIMSENTIIFILGIVMIILFSLNFHTKWTDKTFENVKNKRYTWYWFRVFRIEETKENWLKMTKGISVFVIIITITFGVIALIRN